MELLIFNIFLQSSILLIWFKTDAFLEYCRLFKLNKISNYKDYDKKFDSKESLPYHLYLRLYKNNFFIRLITCPICLSCWLSIIISLITLSPFNIPILFISSLLLYLLIEELIE
jgi:hypothetical protein